MTGPTNTPPALGDLIFLSGDEEMCVIVSDALVYHYNNGTRASSDVRWVLFSDRMTLVWDFRVKHSVFLHTVSEAST